MKMILGYTCLLSLELLFILNYFKWIACIAEQYLM